MQIPRTLTITKEDIHNEIKANFGSTFKKYLDIYNAKNKFKFNFKFARHTITKFLLVGSLAIDTNQNIEAALAVDYYLQILSAGLIYEDGMLTSQLMRWNLDTEAGIKLVDIECANNRDYEKAPNPFNWRQVVMLRLMYLIHCWLKAVNYNIMKLDSVTKDLLINSKQDFLKTNYFIASPFTVNTSNNKDTATFINYLEAKTSDVSI